MDAALTNRVIRTLMLGGMNARDAVEAAEVLADPIRRDSAYVATARTYLEGQATV
jgi:hypothetical protein